MKNESAFKSLFRASVRAQKGYTVTLAAPMLAGTPDLYCIMPKYIPLLLEAKWLKDLPDKGFKRTIPFKPMQLHYMKSINKVHMNAAVGLIGFEWRKEIYCLIYKVYDGVPNVLQSDDLAHHAFVIRQDKVFDVRLLFNLAGVSLIEEYKDTVDTTGLAGFNPPIIIFAETSLN